SLVVPAGKSDPIADLIGSEFCLFGEHLGLWVDVRDNRRSELPSSCQWNNVSEENPDMASALPVAFFEQRLNPQRLQFGADRQCFLNSALPILWRVFFVVI